MKKSLLFIPICIGLAIFFYPTTSNTKENGSPGGKTDSPMDGQNCTGCHGGTINSGTGTATITTNIPVTGYVIGNTYTITLTGVQSGIVKFGFELTAESGNSKTGTFLITNSTETKFATGTNNTAVTHKTAGTSGNTTKIWDVDWTPTANSTASTTFYAALMFANANGNDDSGDKVFTTSHSVNEVGIIGAINDISVNNDFTFNTVTKTIEAQKTVDIYDISGKLVLTTNSNSTNISHLKTGIYILKSIGGIQKIILN